MTAETSNARGWPDYLMIRDTGLHDDMGGGGQRIFTTAGRGYEKVKYIRADLATPPPPAAPAARDGEVVGYIVHSADELTRFEATQEAICLGIGRHAVYTTPPTSVPVERLAALAESMESAWRPNCCCSDTAKSCADELTALAQEAK